MCDKNTDLGHGYPIRSNAIRLQNIVTKEDFVSRQQTTCPKLEKKRKSQRVQVIRQSARPVGQKGYISPLYKADLNETYLQQRFVRISKIGEGSYGAVYSVLSKDDNKMYAVKIVKRYKPPNPLAEISILDKIDGIANCLGYVNAWMENNVLYIQLNLASTSLHAYSFKNFNIEEEELFHILINILIALKGMHSIGLLHMDVKPDNILQHPSGRYVLCDFGLSTYYTKKVQPFKTSEGDSKYLSSDMLRGEISPAGDIFALGITLFEVGHGIVLPDHGSDWHNYRTGRNLILPKGVRELSSELTAIISWMMKKDPLQRPTADTLLKHPTLQKYMTFEKKVDISKWRDLKWSDENISFVGEENGVPHEALSNNSAAKGQLGDNTSGGRLSWGWVFPDDNENSSMVINKNYKSIIKNLESDAAEYSPHNYSTDHKAEKSDKNGSHDNYKEHSNYSIINTRSKLSQGLFKCSTPLKSVENSFFPLDGNSNIHVTIVPTTPTQTHIPVESQKTPESRKRNLKSKELYSEGLSDISPLTTIANHRRTKMKYIRKEDSIKNKEKSASPKTPSKTSLNSIPNIPSGGTPQKRRVARQLDLDEEPLKTPKRDNLDSSKNISIRLNFDEISESDDNCIQMWID